MNKSPTRWSSVCLQSRVNVDIRATVSRVGSSSKAGRISRSSDIDRLFRTGCFRRIRGFKLGYAANDLGHHRVVFAPTRSLRRAVDRNRQKRISREAYRRLHNKILGSYDLVFVIYGDATTTTEERCADMVKVLGAAKLLTMPSTVEKQR